MPVDKFQRQRDFKHEPGEINRILSTHPGMAHFAGTGDARSCVDCAFFRPTKKGNGTCEKYKRLNQTEKGISFPGKSVSCKYVADEKPKRVNRYRKETLI